MTHADAALIVVSILAVGWGLEIRLREIRDRLDKR
jgi:hypothetical protein